MGLNYVVFRCLLMVILVLICKFKCVFLGYKRRLGKGEECGWNYLNLCREKDLKYMTFRCVWMVLERGVLGFIDKFFIWD